MNSAPSTKYGTTSPQKNTIKRMDPVDSPLDDDDDEPPGGEGGPGGGGGAGPAPQEDVHWSYVSNVPAAKVFVSGEGGSSTNHTPRRTGIVGALGIRAALEGPARDVKHTLDVGLEQVPAGLG